MHYHLITGTSQGLGHALAEHLLAASPENVVVGIARRSTITHPRYRHHALNLADLPALENVLDQLVQPFPDATGLTLINNAAVLGEISYLGQQAPGTFAQVFAVNVLAPARLLNAFLAAYAGRNLPLAVLNISSGAARRPLDGWSAYCASKAALEMLTRTAAHEQELLGNRHIRLHALSPGVIDTEMQTQIRAADAVQFSEVQTFRDRHARHELLTPTEAARQVAAFLARPVPWPEVVVALREVVS